MTNTVMLEDYIKKSGYKKSYIANAIGLKSTYGLSKKINNENEFKASEIEILCEILNISDADRMPIFFAK